MRMDVDQSNGELGRLMGVAIDASDNVYVTVSGNNHISLLCYLCYAETRRDQVSLWTSSGRRWSGVCLRL